MRLLHLAAIVLLATALYWSVRLAYADALSRTGGPANLSRARQLVPGNAEDHLSAGALQQACRLNPWNSEAWIERGLRDDSEASLLEAVRVDHTFAPVWTLANYYVRTNQMKKFWPCARACLSVEEHDPEAVFNLCRRVPEDDETLQKAIPSKPRVLSWYLRYLIAREASVVATSAAYDAMMQTHGPKDAPVLLDYCDYLIARQRPEAVAPWNAATGERLNPLHGSSLTNGDFSSDLASRGFDWHVPLQPGITGAFFRSTPALRFTLDGEESESAELLSQTVPVVARRKYRLQFRYRTEDVAPESGLRWEVSNFATGEDLSSATWTGGQFDFETPRGMEMARLSLRYRRRTGTLRLKGTISLQSLTLDFR